MIKVQYIVRDFVPEQDDPLVFDSWMQQAKYSCCPRFRWPPELRREHRQLIHHLTRTNPVLVAGLKDRPLVIYGWACGGLTESGLQVLHMAFVRKDFRGQGIARALLEQLLPHFGKREIYYTHRTQHALKMEKRFQGVWYPYFNQEELF